MEIVPVPAFSDNYLWLVHDQASGETAVVDPGDAAPVLAEAGRRGWAITQVWNTHWHPDHTGGNLAVKEATGATISGPATENIPVATSSAERRRRGSPRQPCRPGYRSARPHARPYRDHFRRRACRICRRHAVRNGLRPTVRRHAGADAPIAATADLAAGRHQPLLRARIYAVECALRRPRRARQCGDRRAGSREVEALARAGRNHAADDASLRNVKPIPSFALLMWTSSRA